MANAPSPSPEKKRLWPLWLILAVLIAGLAATQVQSLRVALLRVLFLKGPRPTESWARERLISSGAIGASIFLEKTVQAYLRINDESDEETLTKLHQTNSDYEHCIEGHPEVLEKVIPVIEERAPLALRQQLYQHAIETLYEQRKNQSSQSLPLSIERLAQMGRTIYTTRPRCFLDRLYETPSEASLEQLTGLGLPLSELDALYAQRLATPYPRARFQDIKALARASSKYRELARIPEDSMIFKVLLRQMENDPDSVVNNSLGSLLFQDWNELPCSVVLALAARNNMVLCGLEFILKSTGADNFDESDETEVEPSFASPRRLQNAGMNGFGTKTTTELPEQLVTQRRLVKGLLAHRRERSLSFVLWAWSMLAQRRATPSWDPELARALSKAQNGQRAAILFVLAHFCPIFDWIEPELRKSLASQDHRERCAALYATALAIGQDEARLQILLNASADQRAHSRRIILLGLSSFEPAQRMELIRALNLSASPESWSPVDLLLLTKALSTLDLESLGLNRQALSQIIDRMKDPLALEALAPILQSPEHKALRTALVTARLRYANELKPRLDFIEACFFEFSLEQRSKLLPDPGKSMIIEEAQGTSFARLAMEHLIQQPADASQLRKLTWLLDGHDGASLPVFILHHGDAEQVRCASEKLLELSDFETWSFVKSWYDSEMSPLRSQKAAIDPCPKWRQVRLEDFKSPAALRRFQELLLQSPRAAKLLQPSPLLCEGWKTDTELELWLAELLARQAMMGSRRFWNKLFGPALDQAPKLRSLVIDSLKKLQGDSEERASLCAMLRSETPERNILEWLDDSSLSFFDKANLNEEIYLQRFIKFVSFLLDVDFPATKQKVDTRGLEELEAMITPPVSIVAQLRLCILAKTCPALWNKLAAVMTDPRYSELWNPGCLACARELLSRSAPAAVSIDPKLFARFLRDSSHLDSWLILNKRPELAAALQLELKDLAMQENDRALRLLARAILAKTDSDWTGLSLEDSCEAYRSWPQTPIPEWLRELCIQRILGGDELRVAAGLADSLRETELSERLQWLRDRALALASRTSWQRNPVPLWARPRDRSFCACR